MFRNILRLKSNIIACIPRLYSSAGEYKACTISAQTLQSMKCGSKGVQLFDVRDPNELQEDGKLPGAVNIPLNEVDKAFALNDEDFKSRYGVPKPKPTDDNLVFSCRAGRRAAVACEKVQKLGYSPLNLEGGYVEWKKTNG